MADDELKQQAVDMVLGWYQRDMVRIATATCADKMADEIAAALRHAAQAERERCGQILLDATTSLRANAAVELDDERQLALQQQAGVVESLAAQIRSLDRRDRLSE